MLVDFSQCTLLDSTGTAVLLDAQLQVRAAEGRFALVIRLTTALSPEWRS